MDDLFMEKVAEDSLLDFDNYPEVRRNIFDRVQNSISGTFPIKNDKYTVELENIGYTDEGHYSKKEQKEALLEGRSLNRKLVGSIVVKDNATGTVVSRVPRKTLMNVPYFTDRGTFIRNGVEYTVAKQFRLIPNVYTRNTAAGTIESQFNIKPRTGAPFRIEMDPATSIFSLRTGGRKIPLYPVLKRVGVRDEDMEESWGKDIYKKNAYARPSPHAINWIRTASSSMQKTAEEEVVESEVDPNLQAYFNRMELDPEGTVRTLGTPY